MTPPSRSRATGRVTLADVAKEAGVSPITVSRALRGERGVATELVTRVQAAAKKMHYVPDPAARALASRHSHHVAILIPLLSNALFVDLLDAVQSGMRAAGYQTLIGITRYDPDEEEQLLREQLVHRPAGLIVTGLDRNPQTRELIAQTGIPCVHVMDLCETPGVYSVGLSQFDAGAAITRHFLGRGRRRIVFAGAQLDPRVMQRRDGWRRELEAAERYEDRLEWLNPAPSSLALGSRMFEEIMAADPEVDAIFFCNDDLAQGALFAAARHGVAVPGRVAVAGFNDLTGSDMTMPALTTVRTPRRAIGSSAAAMLLSLMRGESVERSKLDLGFELVLRDSA